MERDSVAQSIGVLAHRALHQPGFEGHAVACLREAVYFRSAGGPLLWLTLPGHLPHRRAIVTHFDPSSVTVGSAVRASDGGLLFDRLPAIPMSEMSVWSPPKLDRAGLLDWGSLRIRVHAHVAQVIGLPGRRGFGRLLDLSLGGSGNLAAAVSGDSDMRLWQAIFPPAHDVILAGRAGGLSALYEPALGLLGLGPGLTPAGDDFMGGLLFAAKHLRRAYPGMVSWDSTRREAFLHRAREATNQISYAILCDLAHGHGAAPMHVMLWALLHGEEPAQALAAAEGISRIGHTSGWDMLAGVLSGLLLLVDQTGE